MKQLKCYLMVAALALSLVSCDKSDKVSSETGEINKKEGSARNSTPDKFTMAMVDGQKISVNDFEEARTGAKIQYGMGDNLNSDENLQLYNMILDQMIKDKIMGEEYEEAGLGITDKAFYAMLTSEHPGPLVVKYFGNVDTETIKSYIENLDNLPPEAREYWEELMKVLKKGRLEEKYINLLKDSYLLPKPLARKYYENRNIKVTADVVALRYFTIPDSEVNVTDADRKAFYEENKYRYETDERRDIEYVVFDIRPSLEDRRETLKRVQELKPQFVATKNPIEFVNVSYNSSKPYDSTWLKRADVSEQIQKVIFDEGNGVGYVYGPYEDEGAFNLVRIVGMKKRPDLMRASHILIPYNGAYMSNDVDMTKEQAKAKADELLAQLKAAKDSDGLFAQLASQYNTDATKDTGGDLGWFSDGVMVPQFNEYVVNNPVGSMGVVETVFGYHIVKVTGKNEPEMKVRLAYVKQDIERSTETYQAVLAEAEKFFAECRTYSQFDKAVEEFGLTKRVKEGLRKADVRIPGLENPREIVRWAFDENTKKGDVSGKIFELDDRQLVVAAVTNIIPEGYAPLEAVTDYFKYQLINKKKGALAVEKMKACGNDIDRMVNELGAESTTITDITLDSRNLGNFGVEGDIIGMICGMKEGQVVGPVAGNTSAFIIKNVRFSIPEDTGDYTEINRIKSSQHINKPMNDGVYRALRNEAKVEDYRTRFF